MEEQIIGFITAKLAKEKGFDLEVYKKWANYYEGEPLNKWKLIDEPSDIVGISFMEWKAPTQSLLQKWLREEHNILVVSLPWKDHQADINDSYEFRPMIVGKKTFDCYKTYEEALEKGLQEALKLI